MPKDISCAGSGTACGAADHLAKPRPCTGDMGMWGAGTRCSGMHVMHMLCCTVQARCTHGLPAQGHWYGVGWSGGGVRSEEGKSLVETNKPLRTFRKCFSRWPRLLKPLQSPQQGGARPPTEYPRTIVYLHDLPSEVVQHLTETPQGGSGVDLKSGHPCLATPPLRTTPPAGPWPCRGRTTVDICCS